MKSAIPEPGAASDCVTNVRNSRAQAPRVGHSAEIGGCAAPFAIGHRRRTLLAGTAACWGLCAVVLWFGGRVVCPDSACRVLDFDQHVLGALSALQRPWLDAVMMASTWLGSIIVLLPCALALAWLHWRRTQDRRALLLPVAVGGAWVLAHAGKLLVARPRPDLYPALVTVPGDLSFPSAHTMQITAFALACVLATGSRLVWAAGIAAALAVLLVAFSRIYLQVHYPSDVAIAMIAGVAWVLGLRLLPGARA